MGSQLQFVTTGQALPSDFVWKVKVGDEVTAVHIGADRKRQWG